MIPVLVWWLILQVLGWLALPLCMRIFYRLPDQGYASAKAAGLLVSSYILWLGASTGFLYNDLGGILVSILGLGALSAWQIRGLHARFSAIVDYLKANWRYILTAEIIFAGALVLWAVLRAYAVDKIMNAGGEKFMEIAFLNAILQSKTFPPLDPWLSGFAIAYYYFGYVMMALMTRLSGVASGVGFDLFDALLFALTALGSFGIAYNLIARKTEQSSVRAEVSRPPLLVYALLGVLLVTLMGNLSGPLEALRSRGVLPQSFFEWVGVPDLANAPVNGTWFPGNSNSWWWWRGSRVIQDYDLAGNPLDVSPITEFPFFSFLLGDNHPHVMSLPFTLLAIHLALALLKLPPSQSPDETADKKQTWWNPIVFSLQGDGVLFWFTAFVLGGLAFINTWDFPIYLGLCALAYMTGQALGARKFERTLLSRTAVLALSWVVGAFGLYLFFYISFDSQAGGFLPYIFPPTRLVQYFVMFGTFVVILFGFLTALFIRFSRQGRPVWGTIWSSWGFTAAVGIFLYGLIAGMLALGGALARWFPQLNHPELQARIGGMTFNQAAVEVLLDRLQNPWLFLVLSCLVGMGLAALKIIVLDSRFDAMNANVADEDAPPERQNLAFALLLLLFGFLLTWAVEFFYLRDSFMVRMNTVFKFYYQGWIMLACASAYALGWLREHAPNIPPFAWQSLRFVSAILILAGMVYPAQAFYSRTAGFRSEPNLDGASGVARNNPDDWAAIQWLQREALEREKTPIILEAPGKSYTYEGRISAFTGLPTVLGWAIHESQWRGNYDEQGKREPDIAAIYSTHDGSFALELLRKWDVDYVVVGLAEQSYIQQLCTEPARRCNLTSAIRKFEQTLQPVFTQGSIIIYAVPGE